MKHPHTYIVYLLCTCLLLVALVGLPSCKKWLAVPPPQAELTSASLFTDDQSATSAIYGLYSQLMNANLFLTNGGASVFGALSADELYNTTPSAALDPFTANAIPASEATTVANRFWNKPYSFIYQANSIIEGLADAPGVSLPVKQRLMGEAKLVRALCYFYLVNFFGDVPLLTTTAYEKNAVAGRTNAGLVYSQLIQDLQDAKTLLPETYDAAGRTRPNRSAATALLARVYLYRQQWADAEREASEVIASSLYGLVSNLNDVFLAGSKEAIWQLVPVNLGFNTAEGNAFVPASATVRPTYAATASLLAAFDAGDARRAAWLKANTISSVAYFYPFKYKVRLATPITEHNMVLRLAELYLVRAEARAWQGRLTGAAADLNVLRTRASLPNTTANTQAALLAAVEKERFTELFAEWGHRWLDLRRTGRIDAVLSAAKPGWKPTAALFPIPLSELLANPFLTQNPGY